MSKVPSTTVNSLAEPDLVTSPTQTIISNSLERMSQYPPNSNLHPAYTAQANLSPPSRHVLPEFSFRDQRRNAIADIPEKYQVQELNHFSDTRRGNKSLHEDEEAADGNASVFQEAQDCGIAPQNTRCQNGFVSSKETMSVSQTMDNE
ncbi:MAG: hypothetical protein Q9164_000415 [Protoblastenia rupestris]